jgi:hypothetical protein
MSCQTGVKERRVMERESEAEEGEEEERNGEEEDERRTVSGEERRRGVSKAGVGSGRSHRVLGMRRLERREC